MVVVGEWALKARPERKRYLGIKRALPTRLFQRAYSANPLLEWTPGPARSLRRCRSDRPDVVARCTSWMVPLAMPPSCAMRSAIVSMCSSTSSAIPSLEESESHATSTCNVHTPPKFIPRPIDANREIRQCGAGLAHYVSKNCTGACYER